MKRDGYITVKDGTKIFYTIFGDGEPVLFYTGIRKAVAISNTSLSWDFPTERI